MKIAMIGCGKMGGAMLARWVDDPAYAFTVVDPFLDAAPDGARLVRSREALGDETFDALIVAVKPQMIEDVLPAYRDALSADGVVISIAAGFSAASLARVVGERAIVRVMPNLPASIGLGVNGLYANALCSDAQKTSAEKLVAHTGHVVWTSDEDAIDRVTAVAGSGPGYVFEIARAYAAAAEALGFPPAEARDLVLKTLEGAVALAIRTGQPLETLRDSVTSKKGTTQAGLDALRRDGALDALLADTVRAAYDRAVELR